MRLGEVAGFLDASILTGEEHLDAEVQFCCASDLMSDVLAFSRPDVLLLTGLTTAQVIYTAEMAALKAVCFVRGKKPPEEALALARVRGIVVMSTDLSMFDCCGRLYAHGLRGPGAPAPRNDRA